MKYHQIDRDLFIKNRNKFIQMKPKKCCRFNSNDIYPGADSTMPFEQSRDILLKRGSGRKHFIIISGRSYEQRNIISKRNKRPYSRLGR
jgi:Xaa-Pro aminopeptidase